MVEEIKKMLSQKDAGDTAPSPWRLMDKINEIIDVVNSLRERHDTEDFCQMCGGPNVVWHTNNDLWNKVMEGRQKSIICPVCFIRLAENKNIKPTSWIVSEENL